MLQDMNDRHNTALAMLGLVKTLLALDTHKQMVSNNKSSVNYLASSIFIEIIIVVFVSI